MAAAKLELVDNHSREPLLGRADCWTEFAATGPCWAGEPLGWAAEIWTGPLDLDWSAGSGSGCYLRCPGEELTRLAEKERKQRGEEEWSGRFDGGGSRDGELGWSGSYEERLDLRTKSVWEPTVAGEAAGQKNSS
ncbi:hypothetical protein CRG98_039393 [Punica granatum]|uniref:Uncharacterized protein n=1 Tax=Punica granatum TaxID=22663 RepID=A0A2I0I956_PUNGR|nr:hypothetical protein CRG98_039393 [Punica granatum]